MGSAATYDPKETQMLQTLKNRRAEARDNDQGFTLIELMVVVLIIAILLAIAIPTFLGVQNKAKDRAAQSSVKNTHTAAKTVFADNSSFAGATFDNLDELEPSLTFVVDTAPSTGAKVVSVSATDDTFVAVVLAKGGDCFAIKDVNGAVTYAKYPGGAGGVNCEASHASAQGAAAESW
jgi:type IV pilus assembly protein PilA